MVKLSKRMKAVASMVTKGNVVADVGTDHGYVPIALISEGKIPRAIAMDINKGPLESARVHIQEAGQEDLIETRLSDGLEALEEGEVETIIIAGMGGELVMRILKDGEKICRSAKEMILQPQSDLDKVRMYLRENNYYIIDEDMVFEDGKYYPMMKVLNGDKSEVWEKMTPDIIKTCDIYGPILLKNGNPIIRRYLVKQHKVIEKIIVNLKQQEKTDAINFRIKEKEKELVYNELAYTILGAIKDAGI